MSTLSPTGTDRASRLLVVEDEEAIAEGLRLVLERKGYVVARAADGVEALDHVRAGGFDLVILDVRLPRLDGFEVLGRLRQAGDLTPILMLTARNQPDDVVYGLKLGADDYVVKPFDLAELLARVEGLLRRRAWERSELDSTSPGRLASATEAAGGPHDGIPERYPFGDFWIDFGSWQALTLDGVVELTKKEVAVMKVFATRANQVVDRRELLAEVWELPNHPNTRVVDNVIVALRKRFEHDATRPRHIRSVRGAGYRFVP